MESTTGEWSWRVLELIIAGVGAVFLAISGWVASVVSKDRNMIRDSSNRIECLEKQYQEIQQQAELITNAINARLTRIEDEQHRNKEVLVEMATNVRWLRRASEHHYDDDDSGDM